MRRERKRYEKMEKDIRIESQLLDLEKMVRMRIETVVRFSFLPFSLSFILFLPVSLSHPHRKIERKKVRQYQPINGKKDKVRRRKELRTERERKEKNFISSVQFKANGETQFTRESSYYSRRGSGESCITQFLPLFLPSLSFFSFFFSLTLSPSWIIGWNVM